MLVGCHQRDQTEVREVLWRQGCEHVTDPGIPPGATPARYPRRHYSHPRNHRTTLAPLQFQVQIGQQNVPQQWR